MSESLLHRHCQPCSDGTPPISVQRAGELGSELNEGWEIDSNIRLYKKLEFPDFAQSFAFATSVALLAEKEGHHPDLTIGWGHLDISLTTHVAGGLTENDFIIAAKIDAMADSI